MISKAFLQLLQCIVAILVALFTLNLVVLGYSHTGVHIRDAFGATDYKWEPGQWKTTMEEGFAAVRMDANGYNNRPQDCRANHPDILLMGSSQVEGVHVRPKESLSALLNDACPQYYTYSIGVSGHTIYHCMNNLHAAYQAYRPERYILLFTDAIELETDAMAKVVAGEWPRIPSYDHGLLYRVQKAAPIVKALYKKIQDWRRAGMRSAQVKCVSGVSSTSEATQYEIALKQFLGVGRRALEGTQCQLVLVYQPPTRIDRAGEYCPSESTVVREEFAQICHAQGIAFVDMTECFQALFQREYVLAHGFANTAVGVGHLNAKGNRAIAETIVSWLGH